MVQGERYNYNNYEYVSEDVMGGGFWWLEGRWGVILYFLSTFKILLCRLHQEVWGTAQIFQEGCKLKNIQNGLLKV